MKIVLNKHASANEIITKTVADAVGVEGGADFAPHVKCLVGLVFLFWTYGLLPQRTMAGRPFIKGRTLMKLPIA